MHGGGWSTCPSKNLTKCGSIPIVNAAHPIMNYIIANNTNNAIDYVIKVHIISYNEIYAIDHSLTFHMIAHHINFTIDDIILCFGTSIVFI